MNKYFVIFLVFIIFVFSTFFIIPNTALAARIITGVTFNGAGNVIVKGGDLIDIALTVELTNGSYWRSTKYQFGNENWNCADTFDHTDNGVYSEAFATTSPLNSGIYDVNLRVYTTNDCTSSSYSTTTVANGIVVDNIFPVITMLGDANINLMVGDSYLDVGATAADDIDGDITGHIVVNNPVDTAVAGTYIITFNVSDTAGNGAVEVIRTVNVLAAPAPAATPTPATGDSGNRSGGRRHNIGNIGGEEGEVLGASTSNLVLSQSEIEELQEALDKLSAELIKLLEML